VAKINVVGVFSDRRHEAAMVSVVRFVVVEHADLST
jgi:hypothetical protein